MTELRPFDEIAGCMQLDVMVHIFRHLSTIIKGAPFAGGYTDCPTPAEAA